MPRNFNRQVKAKSKQWLRPWFLLLALLPTAVMASAVLSQGYQTTETLLPGTVVSLDKDHPNTVVPSNTDNDRLENILGVVVGSGNALLALSNSQNQVQVATSGVVQVIASDLAGDVKAGDKVTASPINGVAMKATQSTRIIGVAQGDLSDTASGAATHTIKDKNGQNHDVKIGEIPVLVNVAYFVKGSGDDKSPIPIALQNIANAIARKKVDPLPIIISFFIFLVSLISMVSLVYGAIRSSIISIGRNPLSQGAVYRSLLQVAAMVLAILIVSVAAIYLILNKL